MRPIDADALRDSVLKWLPPDPCGQEDKEYPFETDICVSLLTEIEEAPTIEPEYSMDEWCTDCTEYDQERHCCPRFNRVIRETVDEVKANQWISCNERLPEIGKKVLLSEHNTMFIAEYHGSGDPEGLWLVEGYHHYLADVNRCAWMPLPESWKGDIE